jgi:hypothetical protein
VSESTADRDRVVEQALPGLVDADPARLAALFDRGVTPGRPGSWAET